MSIYWFVSAESPCWEEGGEMLCDAWRCSQQEEFTE